MHLSQAFSIALQHHHAGRLAEAEGLLRQILAAQPNHVESLHLLGIIACQSARFDAGVDLIRRAIGLRPNWPQAYNNLGKALLDNDKLNEAIDASRKAISLNPNYAEAHNHLGKALRLTGHIGESITAYRKAITLRPGFAEAHNNLGNALSEQGQLEMAIAAYRHAIALNPGLAEVHSNLGNVLKEKGQLDEAVVACRQAISLNPACAEAYSNLGIVLAEQGCLNDAISGYRRAISMKPGYADAHYNLAHALLLQGDFAQGWAEHEWRWQVKAFRSRRWNGAQPQWDGSDLTHRTILLHAEQGLGDTIQFARYFPLLAERGAKVVVTCPPILHRLLQSVPGVTRWLSAEDQPPPFDVHCPLLSLPSGFGTRLQTIPNDVPYLQADREAVERWRKRLDFPDHPFKIGLAWAGNPIHRNDRNRSLQLSLLAPLAMAPGVTFFSLQTGPAAEEAKEPPAGMKLIDLTRDLKDFADTAALIANLDLVISVDTAVVHLAGALGKPVWTLLPFIPDWRWLLDREDSPWYPTMRLFRQQSIGAWHSVISHVIEALRQYLLEAEHRNLNTSSK